MVTHAHLLAKAYQVANHDTNPIARTYFTSYIFDSLQYLKYFQKITKENVIHARATVQAENNK